MFLLVLTNMQYFFPKIQLKTANCACKRFLAKMSMDNQLRKHTSILTIVFRSSDEHVLLTMFPAELNNCSH